MDDEQGDSSTDKPGEVRFTPSQTAWEYLGWLSRTTVLGRNEREVARQILIDRLAEMRGEDYRGGRDG